MVYYTGSKVIDALLFRTLELSLFSWQAFVLSPPNARNCEVGGDEEANYGT
jgi:hypothetical protein